MLGYPEVRIDPSCVVSVIVLGVGFVGAGLIVYRKFKIEELTMAAGIWIVAAIGTVVGTGLYFTAIFAAFLTLGVLNLMKTLEIKIFGKNKEFF